MINIKYLEKENFNKKLYNKNFNKKLYKNVSKKLFNKFNEIYLDFKQNNKNNIQIKKQNNFEIQNYDGIYITKKIKKKLNKLKKLKIITYDFLKTNVEIILYYNTITQKNINQIMDTINFIITLFNYLNNYRENIKIYIYYSNNNKKININKKNELIPENINSAFTTFYKNETYDNQNYIVIYRTEELNKVLIHELLHLYNLTNYKIEGNIELVKLIKTEDKILISEAYVESFATLLYTFLYSKNNNKDFYDLLNQQIMFSLFQSSKILLNQNIKKLKYPIEITEKANAISYHFIKSAILYNLNKYNNYVFNINNLDKFYLNNRNKIQMKIMNDFNKKILISLQNKNFIKIINDNLKFLIKSNNKKFNNQKLLKTFRMNILD